MIIGITGLPGAGKSYYVTSEILKRLRGDRRCRVITNYHPSDRAQREFGERWRFGLWADMVEAAPNTICVVDEANMWFSSRQWKDQTVSDLAVFKQSRKHGLSLWWVDQHENRVDVAIREVTHWYHRVERSFCISVVRWEEPSSGKSCGWAPVWRRRGVWEYYDSYECIGMRDGTGYRRGRGGEVSSDDRSVRVMFRKAVGGRVVYSDGPIEGGCERVELARRSAGWLGRAVARLFT